MRGDRSDRPHRLAYDAAHLLLAPWSAEFSEPDWPAEWLSRAVHTGAISRFAGRAAAPVVPHAGPRRVLVLWGTGGDADEVGPAVSAARAATPDAQWRIAGVGADAGADVWELLAWADVVVTHGGQNAVAEVAASRRPAVVLADDRPHGEQEATARALSGAGLAVTVTGWPEPARWADLLDRAVAIDPQGWSRWAPDSAARDAAAVIDGAAREVRRPEAVAGRPVATPAGPRVATVTIVTGRHRHLVNQQRGLAAGTRVPDVCVVVDMDDPEAAALTRSGPLAGTATEIRCVSVPVTSGLPLAAARNAGAAAALAAGADVVVFLDVDCVPSPTLVDTYARAVADEAEPTLHCGVVRYLRPEIDAGAVHPADLSGEPHAARPVPAAGEVQRSEQWQLFWSLSFAVSPATWHRVGGFDEGYTGYGAEDTDLGYRAVVRAGVPISWTGGADAFHQYHPTQSPPVQHLDDIVTNAGIFFDRWGFWPMEGWLIAFAEAGLAEFTAGRWRAIPIGPTDH
nr:galactosyltransferase-related protein [Nakamurella flavida]